MSISFANLHADTLWSSPANLSLPQTNSVGAQIAVNSRGDVTAIWSKYNGSNYIVQASVSKTNGEWSKPFNLSQNGQNAFFAKIATNDSGNAVAVWSRFNGKNYVIQAAYGLSLRLWLPAINLSLSGKGQDATKPQVVFDRKGNITAIWQRYNGTKNVIQSVNAGWGGISPLPINLSNNNNENIDPQLAVDANGKVFAIWNNDSLGRAQVASKPLNGGWSAPLSISDAGGKIDAPQIAVNGQGTAVAVWARFDGQNYLIQTASKQPNVQWSLATTISEAGQNARRPQLVIEGNGNTNVIWQRWDGLNTVIQLATKAVDGNWNAPIDLSIPGQDASEPQLKLSESGQLVAVWKRSNGANFLIESSTRQVDGTWTLPVALSEEGHDAVTPQLDLDQTGNAFAIWTRSNGSNTVVQSAVGTNIP
jgi:hypothetical protein